MRTAPDEIKAYPTSCLHRGRRLKAYDGRCSELRCPFHGFAWRLDGRSGTSPPVGLPARRGAGGEFTLPEAKVGTWGGFVFINPDPAAEPLASTSANCPSTSPDGPGDRYLQAHVAKVIRCNWKIAQEAFWRLPRGRHPSAARRRVGDATGQIRRVRQLLPRRSARTGTPARACMDADAAGDPRRACSTCASRRGPPVVAARGRRAREVVGDVPASEAGARSSVSRHRAVATPSCRHFNYTVFPNLHPWGAFNRIVYRFRPNGDDHESCILEVLLRDAVQGRAPAAGPRHWLGADDRGPRRPARPPGHGLKQDAFNMEQVHRGLKATRKPGVSLSRYQEAIVRRRHDLIGQWVGEA